MSILTEGVDKQLRAIIRNKTEEIFKSHKTSYIRMLDSLGRQWQKTVRALVGVPSDRKRNLTPWPKRRTGGLQRSIQAPHIRRDKALYHKKGFYFEAVFSFTKLYQRYTGNGLSFPAKDNKPRGMDVGDYLDGWDGKPFYGWKARASRLFNIAIERASYLRSKNGKTWEVRNFFTREMTKSVESRHYRVG